MDVVVMATDEMLQAFIVEHAFLSAASFCLEMRRLHLERLQHGFDRSSGLSLNPASVGTGTSHNLLYLEPLITWHPVFLVAKVSR